MCIIGKNINDKYEIEIVIEMKINGLMQYEASTWIYNKNTKSKIHKNK